MKVTTTYTTSQILGIYAKNQEVANRVFVSKYRELVDEVNFYVRSGWDVAKAVTFTLEEFAFMVDSTDLAQLKNYLLATTKPYVKGKYVFKNGNLVLDNKFDIHA